MVVFQKKNYKQIKKKNINSLKSVHRWSLLLWFHYHHDSVRYRLQLFIIKFMRLQPDDSDSDPDYTPDEIPSFNLAHNFEEQQLNMHRLMKGITNCS